MITKQGIKWLLKDKHNGQKNRHFFSDLKRLENGEPLDYVIGWKPFLGCHIDLSKKPLIPRPETEFWTQKVIEDIYKNHKRRLSCLDIFAGSGCVGLAVLKNTKNTTVDFAEYYQKFIKQIEINLDKNKIESGRYQIIKSNIFSKVKKKYDYILANPPYISNVNKEQIQKSVILWEPARALFAKDEGLQFVARFLRQAKKYLRPNGKIYLEFGHKQENKIEKILGQYKYENFNFFKDQFGRWRYLVIK